MAQQYFGCDFDWDMAVEADELGMREEAAAHRQAETRTIDSHERVRRFAARTVVRSIQTGGAETRPRVGTADKQRALDALRRHGRGKGSGKGGKQTFDV